MSILKKTRADLSVSLFFHKPCLNLQDIILAMHLYSHWGKTDHFFEVVDSHKREFKNYSTVNVILREFYASQKNCKEKVASISSAQKIKAFIENEKVYQSLQSAGENIETINQIQAIQKKFQGRFVSCEKAIS